MTVRERKLLYVLAGAVALVVAIIVVMQWFLTPLLENDRTIARLAEEINAKENQRLEMLREQKRQEKYKLVSLPGNPELASGSYSNYLSTLLRKYGFDQIILQAPPANSLKMPAAQGKKAAHLTLVYSVRARGDIAGVVKTLRELKLAPISHRVKALNVSPSESSGKDSGKLNVQMTIEALIVHKSDSKNPYLAHLATNGTLKPVVEDAESNPSRNFAKISDRNPFMGAVPIVVAKTPTGPTLAELPPFNILDYVRLVHTSTTTNEAFLYNRVFREPEIRLKPRKASGFEYFVIRNEERDRQLVKGKVLRVDQRDVYFQVGEDIYGIHIGHTLADAMRRSLSNDELEQLELTSLYDEKFAEESMPKKAPAKTPTKGGGKTTKTK